MMGFVGWFVPWESLTIQEIDLFTWLAIDTI